MYAALSAAEYWRLPTVALAHTSPAAYETGPAIAARRPVLAGIGELRRRLSLPPTPSANDVVGRHPVVVATLQSMDPVVRPPQWHYVGPLVPRPVDPGRGPAPCSTDEPVVLVSLSTLTAYGDQTPALQGILDALADSRLRVVVTTGPAVAPDALRVPANATVFAFAPHADLLPAASACITHAGHGTVMAALASAVPLVCRPNPAADQPYVAGRIAELGAGVVLPLDAAPDAIRARVRRVLAEPSFRQVARRLADAIAAAPAAPAAADIVSAQDPPHVAGATSSLRRGCAPAPASPIPEV